MASDVSQLAARYLNACRKREVLPNSSILSSFLKVKHQKSRAEECCLKIIIDQLKSSDFPPLIDVLSMSNLSEIDAVDVWQKSSYILLDGEYVLSLLRAVNQKLRMIDLVDSSSWKDVLHDIYQKGITCQILNLRFSPIQKLSMTGKFMQLHTLKLDFSVHLTSFHASCFSCMPKLMRLSMCDTRVTNLWMTSAALSKLHSLVELRFQSCLCCYDTGPCSGKRVTSYAYEKIGSSSHHCYSYPESLSVTNENFRLQNMQESSIDRSPSTLYSDDDSFTNHELHQSTSEESSAESDLDISSDTQSIDNWTDISQDSDHELDGRTNSEISVNTSDLTISSSGHSSVPSTIRLFEEVIYSSTRMKNDICNTNMFEGLKNNSLIVHTSTDEIYSQLNHRNRFSADTIFIEDEEGCSSRESNLENTTETLDLAPENHPSHHSSPICFEKYYREYMIYSLPQLKVLDNFPVKNVEKEKAKAIFKKYYEHVPYNRQPKESVVSILQRREVGSNAFYQKYSQIKQPYCRESHHSFSRSLSAAKVSSALQPHLHPISKFRSGSRKETRSFCPRQFEYHPSNPGLMVFGTVDGELVVMNHESEKLVGYLPSAGALNSILGLCWLKNCPSKLIAGSDNGSLQMYDVCQMRSTVTDQYCSMNASVHTFDDFEQLTSVHVNSTDEYFVASGFSKNVALYDIGSGRRLQIFQDLHGEHINVVKFAHHSPTLFATASFDHDIKMWDLRQGPSRPCFSASSSKGNVMVCFSPDDHYLLASAIDNEVKQLLAADGRLHMSFSISSTGSSQNYTRSYYMNGRDYIISGSCEEDVVRICCAQTGRRLRDVSLEGRGSRNSMFVQSLRGDPFRAFHMSILAAYWHPFAKSEIVKVNLLQSDEGTEENSRACGRQASSSMGG
ncbi:uncharacterized protein LOC103705263 isoform X2 [Phoenix dactylifera]|uniref:Uncharacterized protein LOC103705263 isoform X2 n=1 Tax=Phoenix dactylifera TaxID=42345 RepID=A0A8B7BX31_PHODC|nr:uncharacterized protein LOC103705263 isoform X2 [Phoenix dactylifera]